MNRVPSSTVFTFEPKELEAMIREVVMPSCPEGMYLESISFEVGTDYIGVDDYPTTIFRGVKVYFAKQKSGQR